MSSSSGFLLSRSGMTSVCTQDDEYLSFPRGFHPPLSGVFPCDGEPRLYDQTHACPLMLLPRVR